MSITLEELQVILEANNKEFRQQMEASQKTLQDATKAMTQSIDKMATEGSKKTSFFQQSMATMAGFIGGEAVLGAFRSARDAVLDFMNDSIQGAMESESAMNSLNSALAQSGRYSKEASENLADFASQMQATTKYEDDLIIKNMALLQSIANLDEQGLKKATTAAADLAAGLGIELEAATRLVGKAAVGETDAFKRYGIAIEEGNSRAQTFANTLSVLEGRFGGRAAAEAKTFQGAVTQLNNAWGDLKEEIGAVITQNLAVINVINEVNKALGMQTGNIKANENSWKEMVGNITTYVIGFIQGPLKLWDDAAGVLDKIAFKVKHPFTEFDEAIHRPKTGLNELVKTLENMGVAAALGTQQMAAGMQAAAEPVNKLNNDLQILAETERARQEEGKTLAEEAIIGMEEDSQLRYQMLVAEEDAKLAKMQEALSAGLISKEQMLMARKALDEKFDKDDLKRAEERKKKEDQLNQLKLQGYSTFFSGLTALSESGNKNVAAIGKAAAVANATMNAYVAIQNALANVPYPANIAAAAGIGVQAFANVARITGVQLADGMTEVPGIGQKDNFPAILAPRERVVDANTNADLKEFLSQAFSGQSAGGTIRVEIELKGDAVDLLEAKLYERERLNIARV